MGRFFIAFLSSVAIIAAAFFVSNQFPDQSPGKAIQTIEKQPIQKADSEQPSQQVVSSQTTQQITPSSRSIALTYIALNDNGKSGSTIGCGDSAITIIKNIPPTQTPLKSAYEMLLTNHNKFYGQSGLYNALYQSDLQVQSITIGNGNAIVKLTGQLQQGGVCDAPRIKAQLEDPPKQFPNVKQVQVYINGILLSQLFSQK